MAVTKVKIGYDEETYGTIAVGGDGKFVFAPTKPDHGDILRQLAETYTRQIETDESISQEQMDAMTAADVLARMADRMQAKHLWAEAVAA